jgi:hypothetical protein
LEANASRYHGKPPAELDWTDAQRQKRAVAEYLAAVEAEAAPTQSAVATDKGEDKDDGPETPRKRRGERKAPKVISPSDPTSAWTAKANKRVQFGYGLNYLIDVENAVIIDVEATPARTYDEVAATKTMIDRTKQCFDLKPKRLIADTAYGTGKFLGWLLGAGITPHIPVWDKSTREDGTLSRSDFQWDKRRGVYVCPNNKVLHTSGTVHDGRTLLYRASKLDCDTCPLKARCCPGQLARKNPTRCSRGCPRYGAAVDGVESLHKVPRRAQTRRDALCTPKNPARLRAHAAQRSVRRARRIPSCCYRAEPQDPGAPSPRAPGCLTFRVVCVTASEVRQLQRQGSPKLKSNMSHQR